MSLVLDIEQNLPPPIILALNDSMNVPVARSGDFYEDKKGQGCGMTCIWNGGGYHMEMFVCGQTYPSGETFYCCSDCHCKVGQSEKVFLSYRWCDAAIADKISGCLRGAGINVIRDVNEMSLTDALSAFMKTAAESRYFVAVMTESYFYSRYCMYELCQIIDSDEPVRAIAVLLGNAINVETEKKIQNYWCNRNRLLRQAVAGIDDGYVRYLNPEVNLLERISHHVAIFCTQWRANERPIGERWLLANCRYLVGAIKTTLRPSAGDATGWTYGNPAIRGERAPDLPPKA